jgi:D-3-phosphoglycerate dehydrogenase
MMNFKVLVPQTIAAEGENYLRENGYTPVHPSGYGREDLLQHIADCDAVLLRTVKITGEILDAGKKLRIVARHGAGFDNVDIQAAAELGIWVTNAPLSTTCSVAENTIALLLMLAKRIPFFINALKEDNFAIRISQSGMEVENKILGIIGLGRIGKEVARKAQAGFDMKVIACDPFCPKDQVPPGVELRENIQDVLASADFISLHMPSTPETKKMFGREQLALMKKTAYLINCARGDVLDEAALAEALQHETIAGAAIDVYDPEPPENTNPLLKLPNVIATPHIASNTKESNIKMAVHAAMEIHRVLSGGKPQWPVNKPKGIPA